ncbi:MULTISPECIES: cytochrome C [unclassified Sphingomonas]|uniref:cytochrome C n=1 Tax=unclassified Sphingomonas TaxID=196159 RepID=UPI000AAF8F59|nr:MULTISPECIES: cytochrome C [unclassified Sphingomonas]MBN8847777.1 cytochrome C [Sphingomonas sp.]
MKPALVLLLSGLIAGLIAAGGVAQQPGAMPGVSNPAQAHVDYKLKCQGCHRIDGSGDDFSNPPMRGTLALFLTVPGGREFIGRVPGVATADLDDARLANLVNWTLYTFDPQHVPASFRPYTAAEIGALRQNPLRLERVETRARLVAGFMQAGKDQHIKN